MTSTTAGAEVARVVLCAGEGRRLRPITEHLPKALCTVANRSLVRWALDSPLGRGMRAAVNAHHLADQVADEVQPLGVHVSHERPEALGTAGALAQLAPWLDGAHVLVHNADAWVPEPPPDFVTGWEGRRPRLLVRRTGRPSDFGQHRFLGVSLLPAAVVRGLAAEPSGLYEVVWRAAWERGELDLVEHSAAAFDVGTPERLLAANLSAGGGRSFVHPSARVASSLHASVALPRAVADEREELSYCVLGPGHLRVLCDPETVTREQREGEGLRPTCDPRRP